MLVNKIALDYLRLATYNMSAYNDLARAIQYIAPDDMKQRKWIQYKGIGDDKRFAGHGLQMDDDKKPTIDHYVAHVSGEESAQLFAYDFEHVYATRLDIQLTLECPSWYRARDFCDELSEPERWKGKGRQRMPELYEKPEGKGDGVTIGSRDSGRYIRVYEKYDEWGKKWLRFEIEYKKSLAKTVYRAMKESYENESTPEGVMTDYMLSELQSLPEVNTVNFFVVGWAMAIMSSARELLGLSLMWPLCDGYKLA